MSKSWRLPQLGPTLTFTLSFTYNFTTLSISRFIICATCKSNTIRLITTELFFYYRVNAIIRKTSLNYLNGIFLCNLVDEFIMQLKYKKASSRGPTLISVPTTWTKHYILNSHLTFNSENAVIRSWSYSIWLEGVGVMWELQETLPPIYAGCWWLLIWQCQQQNPARLCLLPAALPKKWGQELNTYSTAGIFYRGITKTYVGLYVQICVFYSRQKTLPAE